MRWFCVAFATLVVVSTALSRAGSSAGNAAASGPPPVAIIPAEPESPLAFDVAEISEAHRLDRNAAWSATLLLGLPFLIRRRRERLG
jgi:hypothetical protein